MFDFVLSMRPSLALNKKLWFDEKQISLIRMTNQQKVEAVEYFELLDMRYGDINAITQRV